MRSAHHHARMLIVFCFLVATLGCSASPAVVRVAPSVVATHTVPPAPLTSTASPTSAPMLWTSATDGIQGALDRYARAYDQHDDTAFYRLIDQDNIALRRFMQSRFDEHKRTSTVGEYSYKMHVVSVTEREYGFVLAHIEGDDGYQNDWLFHEFGGRWVIAEPSIEQVGAAITTQNAHFTFVTYPWTNAINPEIMQIAEQARRNAIHILGREPAQKAMLHVVPTCGLAPYEPLNDVAFYQQSDSDTGLDQIVMFAPQSVRFESYAPDGGWQADLLSTLTHEYTHMIHARSFDDVGASNAWMSEGLAEYVSGNPRFDEVSDAVSDGYIIPLIAPTDTDDKQDLAHIWSLHQDRSLAYGLAYAVVAYIVTHYHGLAGFWKLARAYDQHSNDLDAALRDAFGISYAKFDYDWRAWLRATYVSASTSRQSPTPFTRPQ